MRFLALIPALVAVLALIWTFWAPARRYIWQILAVAAVNIALNPWTSGVWFFHRAEKSTYAEGLKNNNDFTAYRKVVSAFDPSQAGRMAWIAVFLFLSLGFMAILQIRANHADQASKPTRIIATGLIVLAAVMTLIQAFAIVSRHA